MKLTDIAARLGKLADYIVDRTAAEDVSDGVTVNKLYAEIDALYGEVCDAASAKAARKLPTPYGVRVIDADPISPTRYIAEVYDLGTDAQVDYIGVDYAMQALAALKTLGYRPISDAFYATGEHSRDNLRYIVAQEG